MPDAPPAPTPSAPAPRTPSTPVPVPEPDADGRRDLEEPGYLLNRELTWLNFNFRVLQEANDPRTPLLERAKFVSIVSSNLDEFFMKRIGGLKQQVGAGMTERTPDGRTARQQIDQSLELVRELEVRKRAAFMDVYAELKAQDIELTVYEDLDAADREILREHFLESIYPLLTPQATDPAHPFPFISNLSLNLLVALRHPDGSPAPLARVKVPVGAGSPRFVKLEGRNSFVLLETIIAGNLDLLFPGMEVDSVTYFRVTRNANTESAEEHADDLLAMIESELRERHFAPVVRLEVATGIRPLHRGRLAAELGLDEGSDVFEVEGMLGMRDMMDLMAIDAPELKDAPHHPVDHPQLTGEQSIFHTVREKGSLLLHHPFQSFSTSVERLLHEASRDPKVRAIKMTLYRTSSSTKVIDHLINAARNGKQVAVVVELKARFDEAANIRWASRLEQAGIHVTYGVVGLKTHCKVILVVRQDYDGIRTYAHVGTGNYNAATARIYSDVGLLTSKRRVGREAVELLNYLTTGFKPKRDYRKLLPAPKVLKPALLAKIQREVELHTADAPGLIRIKTNALEDVEVTRALYGASMAGVTIDLLVRDTCRLRPGVPGLSETIRVVGVVGRFLEHARVYYFRNGGDEEYFIGSADCMRRNLESRVETLVSVEDSALQDELRMFLEFQIEDQRSAWDMQADGSYIQRQPTKDTEISCQQSMIDWAEKGLKAATRLRKRKPSGPGRNIK
ncbi:MAG: polyphosphate kinase 1 [Planctomycetota bacterium]|nr:polyphosphate kinase 1 [Planctomycetota bacterium]